MIKFLAITVLAVIFFLIEFVIFNVTSGWLNPNLLVLLVIFFNLFFGIRHSIVAALVCGIIQDSFGAGVFGSYLVSFLFCAYMTTFTKKYLDYIGSQSSRMMIIFSVVIINVLTQYMLITTFSQISFQAALVHVMIPEVVATIIAVGFALRFFKKFINYIQFYS